MSDAITLDAQTRALNRAGQRVLHDGILRLQEAELRRIKADPHGYRDTTLMGDDGLRYRYWKRAGEQHGAQAELRYCYATTRNAAGYWLTWVEVIRKDGTGHRYHIRGHKRRKDAKESAWKSYENHGR